MRPAALHAVFVAEAEKRVVGWLHVSVAPRLETPLLAEINGLVVANDRRNLGTGAKLLIAAEDWAQKKKCKGVSVRSNVIRGGAHRFYQRHGYEHYKTQKAFRKLL
jgi:GNAT superfamily N-acetyltransferase